MYINALMDINALMYIKFILVDKLIGFYIDPRIKSEMEQADRSTPILPVGGQGGFRGCSTPITPVGGAREMHAGNCICFSRPCRGWRSLHDAVVVCMLLL
jgi:hypothetical protein